MHPILYEEAYEVSVRRAEMILDKNPTLVSEIKKDKEKKEELTKKLDALKDEMEKDGYFLEVVDDDIVVQNAMDVGEAGRYHMFSKEYVENYDIIAILDQDDTNTYYDSDATELLSQEWPYTQAE